MKQDLYGLLGVGRDADAVLITQAYQRVLAQASDSSARALLRQAYEVLSNPTSRAAYDARLRQLASPVPARPARVAPDSARPFAFSPGMVVGLLVCLLVGVGVWREIGRPVESRAAKPSVGARVTPYKRPAELQAPAPNAAGDQAGGLATRQAPASAPSASELVYASAAPSVVVVEALDASGRATGSGSGVIIGTQQVMTNCHVVQRAVSVRVKSGKNEFNAISDASDTYLDLCALSVIGLAGPPVVRSSVRNVRVGQAVFAIGAPQGLERTLSQGLVSALRETSEGVLIQTSAAISPGSSGGGLFDDQGRLVGITTFQHKLGQNLNFALPVDWLDVMRTR